MNFDKLNQWLTLLANFGVLVGIFALVIELDQSSKLAAVDAYQTRNSELQALNFQMSLSPQLLQVLDKYDSGGLESLDSVEFLQVRRFNSSIILRMESQYYQYLNGFLEEEVIESTFDVITDTYYVRWNELGILDNITLYQWREEIERRVN